MDRPDTPEARLTAARIVLPAPHRPVGTYLPCVRDGDLLYVSGQGPIDGDGFVTGKVGRDLDVEAGRRAARLTGLAILAAVRAELGSLDRVRRVVKVFGMVNAAPGFNRMPAVIDGCSDLFVEVFGESGRHARSAVGLAELPIDIAVEIEAVFAID